ncbi:hypothetical protein ALC56_00151 [Trachymyrmex septentrionalis]|uniref:Uncharacterized protein n=1 Tax=Trachymyrmex septentrionalis TaxID=34720 RepID=A0A151K1L2_9HYME|nr:hypothetical protein ALC56_00151 [Trachymyrmex septentrionalis]
MAKHVLFLHAFNAGERFLLVYGCTEDEHMSLNAHKYCFLKSANNRTFNFAMLPLTSASAQQHSLQTYYQVQQWRGKINNLVEWGW